MGTLNGESRRVGGAALGTLDNRLVIGWGEGNDVAGESKAKVIPLHSNSSRHAAQRRAAAAGRRCAPTSVAAVRSRQPRVGRADRRRRPRDRPTVASPPPARRRPTRRPTNSPSGSPAVAEFVRKRMTGDYTVDEFGFDPHLNNAVFLPLLRVLFKSWFRVEVSGIENLPETGAALGGRQPRRRAAVRRADDVGRRARQPPRPSRSAAAGRRHGVRHADDGSGRAQGRPHHGLHRRTRTGCSPPAS